MPEVVEFLGKTPVGIDPARLSRVAGQATLERRLSGDPASAREDLRAGGAALERARYPGRARSLAAN